MVTANYLTQKKKELFRSRSCSADAEWTQLFWHLCDDNATVFRPRLNYTTSNIWHWETNAVRFQTPVWIPGSLFLSVLVARLLQGLIPFFFTCFFFILFILANAEGEIRADLHYVSLKRCVRPCVETAYDCKHPARGRTASTICNHSLYRICTSGSSADSKPAAPFHRRRAEWGRTSGDICTASSCWAAFVSLKPFPSSSLPLGPGGAAPLLSLSVSLCPTLYACVRVCVRVWVCVNVWICVWLRELLTLCVFMPAKLASDSQFSETLILLFMKENPFNIFVLINLHTHHRKINGRGEKIDEGNIPFEVSFTWRLFTL